MVLKVLGLKGKAVRELEGRKRGSLVEAEEGRVNKTLLELVIR
jgi:hypothetical protein